MKNATATAKEILEMASMIIQNKMTVRQVAQQVYYSKSTVHRYMVEVLPDINPPIANEVLEILAHHKADRHNRGGASTAKYWKNKKEAITV